MLPRKGVEEVKKGRGSKEIVPVPLDKPDHTESSPHPGDSSPKEQAGTASSQESGTISHLGCSFLWQLHMVGLVLRVRERGERNPAWCCG